MQRQNATIGRNSKKRPDLWKTGRGGITRPEKKGSSNTLRKGEADSLDS